MSEENNELSQQIQPENKDKKRKLTKLEKWFRTMHRWYAVMGRFMVPIKRLGHTEMFNDRSYIYVGNHLSVLDVIPVAVSLDKPVRFMAKKEIAEKRLGKWFVNKSGCIMVNRDGTDVRAVMQAMKHLKSGEPICIFPEGKRNKSNEIFLPFKSGAATLAIKTRTPVIMMIQRYKIKLFRRNYFYYAEPFEFSEYYGKKLTEEDIKEADEKLRARMLEVYMMLDETMKDKKKLKALIKDSKIKKK